MNLKVANLVAVQFGIFVGMTSWLAYSHLHSDESPAAAAFAPGEQRPSLIDYRVDRDRAQPDGEQPAAAAHEYSAAAVQQYSALAAQLYYQQIAPRRYASSGLENGSSVAVTPSYPEVAQEREVVPDYPASQTAAYVPTPQFIAYPQPQFVLFSDHRRFANRCRPAPPVVGAHLATTHRRPNRPRCDLSGAKEFRPTKFPGIASRLNAGAPSCRPNEGFKAEGRR